VVEVVVAAAPEAQVVVAQVEPTPDPAAQQAQCILAEVEVEQPEKEVQPLPTMVAQVDLA